MRAVSMFPPHTESISVKQEGVEKAEHQTNRKQEYMRGHSDCAYGTRGARGGQCDGDTTWWRAVLFIPEGSSTSSSVENDQDSMEMFCHGVLVPDVLFTRAGYLYLLGQVKQDQCNILGHHIGDVGDHNNLLGSKSSAGGPGSHLHFFFCFR